MKILFLFAAGLLIYSSGYAQNVGIGISTPNAKLSISSYESELAGTAASNLLRTNAGILGNLAGDEINLASFGFASNNNSSLGIRAYRTIPGTGWEKTAIVLGMDVDNTVRVGSGFLSINANGNIGISRFNPAFKLDVANGSINTDSVYRIGTYTVLSTRGTGNLFVGRDAGKGNTGTDNTFNGHSAGYSNTAGSWNSFFGAGAGLYNTTGNQNSFFGYGAGVENTTGNNNSFFGMLSGTSNTTGISNSFFGGLAGNLNTSGINNSFFGQSSGSSNTTGYANSFFGALTGLSNTTGFQNSFVGYLAGANNTSGIDNSFLGFQAGASNTTGIDNSFLGSFAGVFNTTGNYNSFFGGAAGQLNTTGSENSFFGRNSGYSTNTGSYNSFFGQSAGNGNTTGSENSFFGRNTGFSNTIGYKNSFFGFESGFANTTGTSNSFFGNSTGLSNTTGDYNSFFGYEAGIANTMGSSNSFFGPAAGYSNTEGYDNSFSGLHAGYANSSGSENTANGGFALLENTTGSRNTAVGYHADVNTGALTNATAIGALAQVDCSNCMVLGSVTGVNGAGSRVNVGIGINAPEATLHVARGTGGFGTAAFHGTTHISHFNFDVSENTFIRAGKNDGIVFINDIPGGKVIIGTGSGEKLTVNGDIWTCGNITAAGYLFCSDIRYKTNVSPLSNSLDKVLQLHGINYDWKREEFKEKYFSDKRQLGFSAQEVETLFPELVMTNEAGYKSVDYSRLTPVLVEAIKEQQVQIDSQQKQIDELKILVEEVMARK